MKMKKLCNPLTLIILSLALQLSAHSELELSDLAIKLQAKGESVNLTVRGKKLDSPVIPIKPLSADYNIDDLGKTADDLRKLFIGPVETLINYNRLSRDDLDKAESLFFAADDKDADPKAVVMNKDPNMRAQLKELMESDFSLQPLLLVQIDKNIVDIYYRAAGTTMKGSAYSGIGSLRLKRINEQWKVLPDILSEDDPNAVVSYRILDALNQDVNSITAIAAKIHE